MLRDRASLQKRSDQLRDGFAVARKAFGIVPPEIPVERNLSEQAVFIIGEIDIGLDHGADSQESCKYTQWSLEVGQLAPHAEWVGRRPPCRMARGVVG
jgi:hypothetical protein